MASGRRSGGSPFSVSFVLIFFVYFIFQIRLVFFLVGLPFSGGFIESDAGGISKAIRTFKETNQERFSLSIWPEISSGMRQVIDVCCYECLYL